MTRSILRIFLICLLCGSSTAILAQANLLNEGEFISPLDIPLQLSGTFGELRTNHFHSGIDIKTNGREGYLVRAIADGEVYRIKVSPYGFGRAVYVRHNNGYVSVYAHLQKFNRELEEYIRAAQYERKNFEVELFPPRGKFVLNQGDTLAFTGNSGGSGGPHLHFEIRDAQTEKIINPLRFGFPVQDNIHPDINYIQVYSFVQDELVASEKVRVLDLGSGQHSLSGSGVVEFNGALGLGINAYDRLNGAPNNNGVYRITLTIDGEKYYDFEANTFAFDETRYLNSHIDYAQKACCKQVISRLYLQEGNALSMYRLKGKMHTFNPKDQNLHKAEIAVYDFHGNVSRLSFDLQRRDAPYDQPLDGAQSEDLQRFVHNKPNSFKGEEMEAEFPSGALYQDEYIEYREEMPCSDCASKVYYLGDRAIPVHKYYSLKIRIPASHQYKKNKLYLASVENGRIADYEGSLLSGDYIEARTRQFGGFALAVDEDAPLIAPLNLVNGKPQKGAVLKFKMQDKGTGVEHYQAYLDGKWILMEYDPKYNLLSLDLAREGVSAGAHELKISATDKLGNTANLQFNLRL